MSVSWRRRHRLPAPERRSGNARSPPSLCVVRASGRICPDRPRPQRERCPPPRGEARAPCPLGAEARRGHVALSGCRARRCFLQSVERAFDLLQALRGDSRIVRRRLDVGVPEDALQDPYILAIRRGDGSRIRGEENAATGGLVRPQLPSPPHSRTLRTASLVMGVSGRRPGNRHAFGGRSLTQYFRSAASICGLQQERTGPWRPCPDGCAEPSARCRCRGTWS